MRTLLIAGMFCCMSAFAWAQNAPAVPGHEGLENLGMISIRTTAGRYLQAHNDNGELHSSNEKRNEEETWFLVQIDKPNSIYTFYNWKSGKVLGRIPSPDTSRFAPFVRSIIQDIVEHCAPASQLAITDNQKWELVSGKPFGVLNAIAIKQPGSKKYLLHKASDTVCHGEVMLDGSEPSNSPSWDGWWFLDGVTAPSPGNDVWNQVGGFFLNMANKITPVNIFDALKGLF